MSFPVYIPLFGFKVHPHFIFESLAYTVGFFVYRRLKVRYGDPVEQGVRWSVIAAAAFGSVLGSKFLYWLEDPARIAAHWQDPVVILGGKTIVGGLIGGLIAVEWVKKRIGEHQRTGDLFAIPLCIGLAIGRIGCFLSGLDDDTYGSPTSLPWGINFGDGKFRHPAPLYELIFALLLAAFLYRLMNRPHLQGEVFKAFMVAYFGWRLAIDFIKPDARLLGATALQWASVAMLVFYSRDIFRWLTAFLPTKMAGTRVAARIGTKEGL